MHKGRWVGISVQSVENRYVRPRNLHIDSQIYPDLANASEDLT